MKILITGGSGFIGSHLAEALNKIDHKVYVFDVDKPKFENVSTFIKGDIRKRRQVFEAVKGKDLVFHLAGILGTHETVSKPIATTETNVIGTLNALDAALKQKAEFIFISKPNVWLNPYTISKVASESYSFMYHKEFGLPVKIVVWFNVYGPRQRVVGYQKAIPTWIIQALRNQPLTIFGDGKQTMDLIYTQDTVEATIAVMNSEKCLGKRIEIGSGKESEINKVAKLIIELTKSKSSLLHVPMRRGETPHTRIKADLTLLKKLTGYLPKTPLKEGLLKTIKYYQSLARDRSIKIQ